MRFYGFSAEEILPDEQNLSQEYDPKCAWALRNMHIFPVEINSASPELLVRVPGIGFRSANKIVRARKYGALRFEDLARMRIVLKRAMHFITVSGKFYGQENYNILSTLLSAYDNPNNFEQLNLFSSPNLYQSVLTGEI